MRHRLSLLGFVQHAGSLREGFETNFHLPSSLGFVGAGLVTFPAVFSRHVGFMLGLALAAIVVDFLAGVFFAFRRRDPETGKRVFSIDLLYEGGWKKIGRSFLVLVAAIFDGLLYITGDLMGQEPIMGFTSYMPWTMVAGAWIVVGECASTLETLALYGGDRAVPEPFRRVVRAMQKWIAGEDGHLAAGIEPAELEEAHRELVDPAHPEPPTEDADEAP